MHGLDLRAFTPLFHASPVRGEDIPAVLRVFESNAGDPGFGGHPFSRETIMRDMALLPPGSRACDKYYLALRQNGAVCGVLDIVAGYPQSDTAFIGLFMLEKRLHGRGAGTAAVSALCDALARRGVAFVQLAYEKDDARAARFWQKNGFHPLRETVLDGCAYVAAQRRLLPGDSAPART